MSWPPPDERTMADADTVERAGLDPALRTIYTKVPICMGEYCGRRADWRSDDGYWFCDNCAYWIYLVECELDHVVPMGKQQWNEADRPHGPDQHHHFRTP